MNEIKMQNSNLKQPVTQIRDQIRKWREERQMRLAARLLHNRKDVKVSSAVFGAVSASDAEPGPSEANLNLSSAVSVSKNRPSKYKKRNQVQEVPKIKHTKASKLRIIKANPLLEARGLITLSNTTKKEHNISNLPRKSIPESKQREPTPSVKKSIVHKESIAAGRQISGANSRSCPRNYLARRSLSAAAFTRERTNERFGTTPLRRTHSVDDDDEGQNSTAQKQRNDNDEAGDRIFSLPLTPRNFQTPQIPRSGLLAKSSGKKRVTFSNIHTPTAGEMREKLSNWLLKRGKSLGEFHHLHCFGIHSSNVEDNTEKKKIKRKLNIHNLKSSVSSTSENETSFPSANETFCLEESSAEDKENAQNSNSTSSIRSSSALIKDVMADLLNVIQIGYPWEQCEEWLMMIRRTSPQINEQPIYWECLAGIEEARGDFKSAVDCYERAIVRGALPSQVGESLENLMEKFNLLNLNCYSDNDVTCAKTPRKQVLDARNVFKSSVIKFALQQKALKSLSTNLGVEAAALHYVVTPVRRSTRASLSRYRLTPHMHCVSSINDLERDVQDSMLFQPNCALEH